MLEGSLDDSKTIAQNLELDYILKLAHQSHEDYLVCSNKKDLEDAIDFYVRAIKIDPFTSEAYYKLASLLWERGDIDVNSALEQCQKAIKLNPKSSIARLYLGYFLKTAGKFDEAEAEFKNAISLSRFTSAKPRISLAVTLIQKMRTTKANANDVFKAIYYYSSGLTMLLWDFNALKIMFRSVDQNISTINYKISGNCLEFLKKYQKAIDNYQNAAQKTGKIELFYSKIGDLSSRLKNSYSAINAYKKALRSNPDNISIWVKLAEILQRDFDEEIYELTDCFLNISRLDPSNSRVYYELGHLYLKAEDKFNAINAFKKAVELDSNNPYYHNSLAYALIHVEDFDGTIAEYQKAIRLNPVNEWTSIVSQALGAIYHQVKNNLDAAINAYQTAIVLDPKNIEAYIALAEAYYDNNDLNAAIDTYCEVIKQNPYISKVYSSLGSILIEKGQADAAIVAFNKAVSLDTQDYASFNSLGLIYLECKSRIVEAMSMFKLAIKHNPNYAYAHYNMGRTCEIFGNEYDAAKYYQMAIDLNKITQEFSQEDAESKLYDLFSVK